METIFIIKIGGNIIDDENALSRFLADFSKIDQPKILIHGGGKIASTLGRQLNVEPVMVDGRRVTDKAALDIVTMSYAGLINKKIVVQLQQNNCNAIGLTGADGNVIEAHKRPVGAVDFGFVGDIDKINSELLEDLLDKKRIPVIAPLTHDGNGNLLNTNADTIAAEIAICFSKKIKTTLIYCFEKKGLLADVTDEQSIIHSVTLKELRQLVDKQIITEGMIPKINNINNAVRENVEKVILCDADDLLSILVGNAKFGTIFTKQ